MRIVYIGLGSNLGNRLAFLRGGRDALLNNPGIRLVKSSRVYETEPVGGPQDNPLFLNAVLQVATSLSPRLLLEACLAIEDDFGRTRPIKWAPRTLDVDILLYDDLVINEPDLVIPHPRLHERAFVLAPLREIAAQATHPLLQKTIGALATGHAGVSRLQPMREAW